MLTLYVIETSTLCGIDVRHKLFVSLMFVSIVLLLCVYHDKSIQGSLLALKSLLSDNVVLLVRLI